MTLFYIFRLLQILGLRRLANGFAFLCNARYFRRDYRHQFLGGLKMKLDGSSAGFILPHEGKSLGKSL